MNKSQRKLKQKLKLLNKMIVRLCDESRTSDAFFSHIDMFLRQMADVVLSEIPGFGFGIYGSLMNGFATKDSDLDISIVPSEGIHGRAAIVNHLNRISEVLHRRMGIWNSVIDARVPIIKCERNVLPITMDISYNNQLAFFNTRLLNLYCEWEPDCLPQLGIFLKSWTKTFNICDASRKYPCSYAWILMLIHFLQNCTPPVLPCLQKKVESKKELNYEEWIHGESNFTVCTTFEENWSKNTKTTGELFLEFLNYLKQFDGRNMVMQTSQLGTDNPGWVQKYGDHVKLLVQDPFISEEHGTIGAKNAAEVYHIFDIIDLTLQTYDESCCINAARFFDRIQSKIDFKANQGCSNTRCSAPAYGGLEHLALEHLALENMWLPNVTYQYHPFIGPGPSHQATLVERCYYPPPKPISTQESLTQKKPKAVKPKKSPQFRPETQNEPVQDRNVENENVQPMENQFHPFIGPGPSHQATLVERFHSKPPKPVRTQKSLTKMEPNTVEPKKFPQFPSEDRNEPVQDRNVENENVQPMENQEDEPNLFEQSILPPLLKIGKEISPLDILLFFLLFTFAPYLEKSNLIAGVCVLVAWILARAFLFPHNDELVQHSLSIGFSPEHVIIFISTPIFRLIEDHFPTYFRYFNCVTFSGCRQPWCSSTIRS